MRFTATVVLNSESRIHESKILPKSPRSTLLCMWKMTPASQKKDKKNSTKSVEVACKHYFVCKIGDRTTYMLKKLLCRFGSIAKWKTKKHTICSANNMA